MLTSERKRPEEKGDINGLICYSISDNEMFSVSDRLGSPLGGGVDARTELPLYAAFLSMAGQRSAAPALLELQEVVEGNIFSCGFVPHVVLSCSDGNEINEEVGIFVKADRKQVE